MIKLYILMEGNFRWYDLELNNDSQGDTFGSYHRGKGNLYGSIGDSGHQLVLH